MVAEQQSYYYIFPADKQIYGTSNLSRASYKAGYTLSVMCDSFTENTLVKYKTTSSIYEIVI